MLYLPSVIYTQYNITKDFLPIRDIFIEKPSQIQGSLKKSFQNPLKQAFSFSIGNYETAFKSFIINNSIDLRRFLLY